MRFAVLFFSLLIFGLTSCSRQGREVAPFVYRQLQNDSVVIIDPGHGGVDPGTIATFNKRFEEKDFTLTTARILKNHLSNLGYRVVLTRNSDRYITLVKRVRMANKVRNAVFVSLHFNASKNSEADGVEVFYHQSLSSERRLSSKELASNVLNGIIKYTQADSRGVKKAKFEVLRKTVMPAILVEAGFLTNEEELNDLRDPKYLNAVAWGIARGIDNYLN
ncbi:MAG: N-acetylmuramoyl-L-alanine amidase [Chlamydiales bacterium]|nr:N-acetylmuramoyl-L-alanine amidase [Chlamydiales bacterium]